MLVAVLQCLGFITTAEIELNLVACQCFLIIKKMTFYSIYIFLWYKIVLRMYTWKSNDLLMVFL